VQAVTTVPTGTAGLTLADAPTFSVKDGDGHILGGVAVTVAVTAGGGTLTGAPSTTTADAPTSIGTWTLGRTAGPNTVTVTVGSLTPLVITVTGVAGPAASVAVVSGDAQSALAGTALPAALTAQVRDQFGNGVAGRSVTFSVSAGGGSISPASAVTDASGNASATAWTLGKSASLQSVSVASGVFAVTATATVSTNYSVDLRFFGPDMPAEATAAFTAAAARIRASLIGDITDTDIPSLSNNTGIDISSCGPTGVVINEIVDDVIIYASVATIDGPGKILASAGPCVVRLAHGADCVPAANSCSSFALVGVMRFDVEDIGGLITTGRLNEVILHEMMHVVGVGTNWASKSLLSGKGTQDPRFLGALGIASCTAAGGGSSCVNGVAVENSGGPGTADSHWRESVFDSELMTGFVEAQGVPDPLSNITLQSLADEGYIVNPAAADPYTVPTQSAIRASRALRGNLMVGGASSWEDIIKPAFVIENGTIRKTVIQ
jgi:hypothetical protein